MASARKLIGFDWAMKRLYAVRPILTFEGFLSELLFEDITVVEILESESNKDQPEAKPAGSI